MTRRRAAVLWFLACCYSVGVLALGLACGPWAAGLVAWPVAIFVGPAVLEGSGTRRDARR